MDRRERNRRDRALLRHFLWACIVIIVVSMTLDAAGVGSGAVVALSVLAGFATLLGSAYVEDRKAGRL